MRILVLILAFTALTVKPVIAQNPVKIGLLIQDKNALAAKQGAELAIKRINANGGIFGQPVELFTKSMEGPWGTGSKQAVDLIWEEGVCVLLGSHDGRNAHLVEQASAKSITPFMSAWSSDPSLSQAFIPWFFNCIPNDEQQAEAITVEVFKRRNLHKVLVISDNSYDSNQALKSFLKVSRLKGYSPPLTLNYDSYSNNPDKLLSEIKSSDPDCIILVTGPQVSYQMTGILNKQGITGNVYGYFLALNENRLSESELQMLKKFIIFPDCGWSGAKLTEFATGFKRNYGKNPGAVAAFAYDAANVLIEAIRIAGSTDNDKIRQSLSQVKYEGITGMIQFGDLGVRLNACFFTR